MSTGTYCVDCPCDFLGVGDNLPECQAFMKLFEEKPRLGQIYSGLFETAKSMPIILDGVSDMVQSDLSNWLIKLGLGLIIPWFVMFIVLFIVLTRGKVIGIDTCVILITGLIALTILMMFFIYQDSQYVITNLYNQVKNKIDDNWQENKNAIGKKVTCSYSSCAYCSSTTPGCNNSCGTKCGIDIPDYFCAICQLQTDKGEKCINKDNLDDENVEIIDEEIDENIMFKE